VANFGRSFDSILIYNPLRMNDSQPIDNLDSIAIILLSREFERFSKKLDRDQIIAAAYAWANQVIEERSKYIDVPLSPESVKDRLKGQ
jgi:hypothetical protein